MKPKSSFLRCCSRGRVIWAAKWICTSSREVSGSKGVKIGGLSDVFRKAASLLRFPRFPKYIRGAPNFDSLGSRHFPELVQIHLAAQITPPLEQHLQKLDFGLNYGEIFRKFLLFKTIPLSKFLIPEIHKTGQARLSRGGGGQSRVGLGSRQNGLRGGGGGSHPCRILRISGFITSLDLGLRVLMYSNVSDYLPTTEEAGVRIAIHAKSQVPFPDTLGLLRSHWPPLLLWLATGTPAGHFVVSKRLDSVFAWEETHLLGILLFRKC